MDNDSLKVRVLEWINHPSRTANMDIAVAELTANGFWTAPITDEERILEDVCRSLEANGYYCSSGLTKFAKEMGIKPPNVSRTTTITLEFTTRGPAAEDAEDVLYSLLDTIPFEDHIRERLQEGGFDLLAFCEYTSMEET